MNDEYTISQVASVLTEDPSRLVYEEDRLADKEAAKGIKRFLTESIVGTDTIFEDMQAAAQYLLDEGYDPATINEGIWDWLRGIGSNLLQTIKEKTAGFALRLFGVDPSTGLGKYIKLVFGNVDLKDIPRLFTDCQFAVDKFTDGLSEYFIRGFTDDIGGDGVISSTIGNALAGAVNDDGFVQTLQDQLVPKICDTIKNAGRSLLSKGQELTKGGGQAQGGGQPAIAGA